MQRSVNNSPLRLLSLVAVTLVALSACGEPPLRAAFAGHTHLVRDVSKSDDYAVGLMLAFTHAHHVRAMGIGSPWSHATGQTYRRFDRPGPDRDRYYAGKVDEESVMERDKVQALIDRLNREAAGETLFYLDNETPKMRYGHLWHIGWAFRHPAWHDYDQDRWPQFCDLDKGAEINPEDASGFHRRRTYAAVVAEQRRHGAVSIWAHPTSWWTENGRFVPNIAADLVPQLLGDAGLGGLTVMGYDSYHPGYQNLWFAILDRGYRVPGFAELDLTPEPGKAEKIAHLNFIPGIDRAPTLDELLVCVRAQRHAMSSGPHLWMTVDGLPTGSVIAGTNRAHRVEVVAWPAPGERTISRVELVGRGGQIVAVREQVTGGTLVFEFDSGDGGWLIARAFGEQDGDYQKKRQQAVKHCALTNPVYFETSSFTVPERVQTELTIVPKTSAGRPLRITTAGGDLIFEGTLPSCALSRLVPVDAVVSVARDDGSWREIPVAMANGKVRELMHYLVKGRFRNDYPGLEPGEVPVAAFRIDEMREALKHCRIEL